MRIIIIILVIILIILFILIIRATPNLILGGVEVKKKKPCIGRAIHNHVKKLNKSDSMGEYDLSADNYTFKTTKHVHFANESVKSNIEHDFVKIGAKGGSDKEWFSYNSWDELKDNKKANEDYFRTRTKIINHPELDWSEVLNTMRPLLDEDREYIGIANLKPDGKTLYIKAYEASTIKSNTMKSELAFAGVPNSLVVKYANQPGLILFHTHPADRRASPLPSSHDLSTAIYLGATSRFAACAVISRYGVLMHGLGWDAYKAITSSPDWNLSTLNLSHDVVAAHEAIRSWSPHTPQEYLEFYPRHRLLMYTYPSPEMVGDSHSNMWVWDLEAPIDHEIIIDHSNDISNYISNKGREARKKLNARKGMYRKLPSKIDLM